MESKRRRERRNITLAPELDEYIADAAERGHRPYSRQVEMMLETAMKILRSDMAGTQVAMPTTDADREAMLERIR